MTQEQALKEVETCISSIFTKEDVLNIIKKIDVNATKDLEILFNDVSHVVENYAAHDDIRNEEFGINGDRIYLESFDIDLSGLSDEIHTLFFKK